MNKVMTTIKSFTNRHVKFSKIIIYLVICIICIFSLNKVVIPTEKEVSDICNIHLQIFSDFSNVGRYENAYSEKIFNEISNTEDTLVTVKQGFYKVVARYDPENKLISMYEQYTLPFYPHIIYVISIISSIIIGSFVITILKKKNYFQTKKG